MNRGSLLIVAVALLAGLAGLAAGRWFFAPTAAPAVGVTADALPAATGLPDLGGQLQTLQQFRGAPLVINFWATWCAPCIRELPLLDDWHTRRGDDGIAVLAVALEPESAPVAEFVKEHGLGLPVWIEAPGKQDLSVRLGNHRGVLPFSVLLDADGKVLERHAGELDAAKLGAWRTAALDRKP